MIDNYPYHQPRVWYDNEASGVQGTGYALLTYMNRFLLRDSFSIMTWLQTMRNTLAGFASSQVWTFISFFSYAIYLCFGIPPYFIGAYHRLIFLLAENGILSPDEASSGLLKLDFRFEMC